MTVERIDDRLTGCPAPPISIGGDTEGLAPLLLVGAQGGDVRAWARSVHETSAVRTGPFVPVRCEWIQGLVGRGQLFGHVAGAFPGARSDALGAIQAAHGGTLFLEGADCLDHTCQIGVLELLRSGRVQPLGAEMGRRVDVRVIASFMHSGPDPDGAGPLWDEWLARRQMPLDGPLIAAAPLGFES